MNIDKLWEISGCHRISFSKDENLYFDPVGLILFKNFENMGYWCTPMNTVTFATTGGDGVHFGFLCENEAPNDSSPIVMTLPCADTTNIIVGDNLLDFLSLGCKAGYFDLEQIEYQPEKQLSLLNENSYPPEMDNSEIVLLSEIQNRFSLSPWLDNETRLEDLKHKYLSALKYSGEYYEIMA